MKKKPTKTDISKRAVISALEKTLGIVSGACKKAGVDRSMHYQWLKDDPDYKARVEDVNETVLDFSESALHKAIAKGNVTANIFHLKTKGKKRGYIEKMEVDNTHTFTGAPVISFDDTSKRDDKE